MDLLAWVVIVGGAVFMFLCARTIYRFFFRRIVKPLSHQGHRDTQLPLTPPPAPSALDVHYHTHLHQTVNVINLPESKN